MSLRKILAAVLLTIAGLGLLAAIAGGAFVAYWIWNNVTANIPLYDQKARIEIADAFPATVDILDPLSVNIDTVISANVPINQTLTIPLEETFDVKVNFNGQVPIKMTLPVHQSIHIDQVIPIDGKVSVKLLGAWIKLPLKGSVPVKADIPVNLSIPIDRNIDLAFSAPAQVAISDKIKVRLDTNIIADIPVKKSLSIPVLEPLRANVTLDKATDITIRELNIDVPLEAITFSPSAQVGDKP